MLEFTLMVMLVLKPVVRVKVLVPSALITPKVCSGPVQPPPDCVEKATVKSGVTVTVEPLKDTDCATSRSTTNWVVVLETVIEAGNVKVVDVFAKVAVAVTVVPEELT